MNKDSERHITRGANFVMLKRSRTVCYIQSFVSCVWRLKFPLSFGFELYFFLPLALELEGM